MAIAFTAAGTTGDEQILDVAARFVSGGDGDGRGVRGTGARLLVWDLDGWRELGRHTASTDAPS